MLLLTSTSDKIQVVTDASANVHVHASWVDNAAGTITPGRTDTAYIQTGTTTDVVASPAPSTQRNVRHLNVRNAHATVSSNVTVQHTDGTSTETIIKVNLLVGEVLVLNEFGRWAHYDVSMGDYAAAVFLATRGQMENATVTDLCVTPSLQHYHPAHPKAWVKHGVTGNILASYNMSSVTDTATGQSAPQISTDFSDTNWICGGTLLRNTTNLGTTNVVSVAVRSATQTAGAVTLECQNNSAALVDPGAWYMQGLGTAS